MKEETIEEGGAIAGKKLLGTGPYCALCGDPLPADNWSDWVLAGYCSRKCYEIILDLGRKAKARHAEGSG